MKVTMLGLGAMGTRMADRLAAAGHAVTRWNRTGATMTPRQAVTGAEAVVAMVRDDEASRVVWLGPDGALAGLAPGALAIDSSTLTPAWVRSLGEAAAAVGVDLLDAPVIGSRPQAEAGQLIHLIGGDPAVIERARPLLAAMGPAQLHAGPIGSGAALKLVANTLFGVQVAALAELLGRLPTLGLPAETALALLGQTPVLSPAARGAAGLMLAGRHEPLFPIDLVAKDLRYALGEAGPAMPIASATLARFDQAVAAGLGDANLTALATLDGAGGEPVRQ